ncbi:MAG: type II secretion system F family protein [Candidatus Eremiobacteraeota bacterium]|nr:type II secretion system F family protein [Candidatus Eremiobacteraeota bacterium]MBC5802827.1 type II secretion system F family protein [Candidatus Eremiobacteraeota bacterium]MBC5821129.1 type II secretion system F family protein [Candidatus Eremiobacteraeota bacterium]
MSLTFAYRARTPSGERVAGTMRALDRTTALGMLRERMLIPSSLESTTAPLTFGRFLRRHAPAERLAFFRAYAALERSGVDFSTAFELLIGQARTARFRDALSSIKADVERGGEKLWTAMSHRPDDFTDLEVAMVAAGEEAGNREEIFDRLALFLERDERLRKRLQSALLYPALVVITAACVCVYLFTIVVPQFAKLFVSFDVPLSPAMAAIVAVSNVAQNPLFLLGAAAALWAAGITVAKALRTTEGALAFDALRLRLPLVGEAIRKTIVARLCRVLATLLQSGVNAVRALEVAAPVAESPLFARAVEGARDRIAGGVCATLDEALSASQAFPPLVLGFVRVGGSAGTIPHMLAKIAEYYEEDVESLMSALPTLIQTAVTIGLGVIVAVIVYVVYVPLAQLGTGIR